MWVNIWVGCCLGMTIKDNFIKGQKRHTIKIWHITSVYIHKHNLTIFLSESLNWSLYWIFVRAIPLGESWSTVLVSQHECVSARVENSSCIDCVLPQPLPSAEVCLDVVSCWHSGTFRRRVNVKVIPFPSLSLCLVHVCVCVSLSFSV